MSAADSNVVYVAGRDSGVFRSDDGGDTWALKSTGISSTEMRSLARRPGPESNRVVAVGRQARYLAYATEDAGATWDTLSPDLTRLPAYSVAVHPDDEDIIYVGTSAEVYRTSDGGSNWEGLDLNLFGEIFELVINPDAPETVYAISRSNVIKTTNGGGTWELKNSGLPGDSNPDLSAFAMAPSSPDVLYAGSRRNGARGVYKSIDGGDSWIESNQGAIDSNTVANDIAVHPDDPDIVYVSTGGGLYRSTDGGANWSFLNSIRAGELLIDPRNPNIMYADTFNEVARSIDGGASWSALAPFNTPRFIYDIELGPDDVNVVYAAQALTGVYAMELVTDLAVTLEAEIEGPNVFVGDVITYTATVTNLGEIDGGCE